MSVACESVPFVWCVPVGLRKVLTLLFVLGVCAVISPQGQAVASQVSTVGSTTTPRAVTWRRCARPALRKAKARCATLRVPLDYDNPSGATLVLALSRVAHTAKRFRGVVLTNPGGPGLPGLTMALEGEQIAGKIARSYDWIGIDTRGVGASRPRLACDAGYLKRGRPAYPPAQAAAASPWVARSAAYAQRCSSATARDLLGHLRSLDTVRDFESIRQALGVDQVNFYGVGYGTHLGELYAAQFPDRVRRLILDGARDPEIAAYDQLRAQTGALTPAWNRLTRWVSRRAKRYHLGRTPTASARIIQRLIAMPGTARLGSADVADIVAPALADAAAWAPTSAALAELKQGRPRQAVRLYRRTLRASGGENGYAVRMATTCTDNPQTLPTGGFGPLTSSPTAPIGLLKDGRLYGTSANMLMSSSDMGATWQPVRDLGVDGGAVVKILDAPGGEILLVRAYRVLRSTGWSASPATARLSTTLRLDGRSTFYSWGVNTNTDGSKVVATSYVGAPPFTGSRFVWLSTDGGLTWSVIYDLEQKAAEVGQTNDTTHLHFATFDPWAGDRIWIAWHAPGVDNAARVAFSDDLGRSWVTASDNRNPTFALATPRGMIFGSDGVPDGLAISRRDAPARVETLWMAEGASQTRPYGFAYDGTYDDVTGLAHIAFIAEAGHVPYVVATDGNTAKITLRADGPAGVRGEGFRRVFSRSGRVLAAQFRGGTWQTATASDAIPAWPAELEGWTGTPTAAPRVPAFSWRETWRGLPCRDWPVPAGSAAPIDLTQIESGALLVQSQLDPENPLPGALSVRAKLPDSALVVTRGTVTTRATKAGGNCLQDAVGRYLRSGALPNGSAGTGADLTCPRTPVN